MDTGRTGQQVRAEAAEAKLAAVEERDRWTAKIRELSKVQEEKDKYYAEVLELRQLKYAADRKAKGSWKRKRAIERAS